MDTAHLFFFLSFFRVFAKTLYVRFVPTDEHLEIACFFHDWKKVEKKVSPPISPFLGDKRWNLFLTFFTFFWSTPCLWIPAVCRRHTVILFCWQFVLLFVLRSLAFSARQNTWMDNLRKFIMLNVIFLLRNYVCACVFILVFLLPLNQTWTRPGINHSSSFPS